MPDSPTPAKPDEASPLERALRQPLLLGLFLPLQSGGWTPSAAPRGTSWTFDYNARLVRRADELGFDLAFGLSNWVPKDGYGGDIRYRADYIDTLMSSAAFAPLTRNIILVSTLHVLYAWHPLHLARFGATLDHISGGRWGMNVVTGYRPGEIEYFGLPPIPHDQRYALAGEFVEALTRLWTSDEAVTIAGKGWSVQGACMAPRPLYGRPILVNAAVSDEGLRYAARHSDLVFITSPGGADIDAAAETLPAVNAKVKGFAREYGREVRTIINPHIFSRPSQAEVDRDLRRVLDATDDRAVAGLAGGMERGDQSSWKGHSRDQWRLGGNVHLIGTPDKVVEGILRLKQAGCDGIQVNFFDYEPDLEFFGSAILPRLKEAGLRRPD